MNFVIRSCLGNRDPRSPEARQRCGTLAGGVGILLNLLLFLAKLIAGLAASSVVWGDSTVTLPENGVIAFAGDAGARFYISVVPAE